jgi:hypothetical protein
MFLSRRRFAALIAPLVTLALSAGATSPGFAQDASASATRGKSLEGTWRVQVTLVDCATGAERPPFWSLVTFAPLGTTTDTTANQSFPGQRTPGHGVWYRHGRHAYTAATEAFILFGPTLRPWVHRIEQEIELTSADTFASQASVAFTLAPGTQPAPPVPLPPAPLCATALGYRF